MIKRIPPRLCANFTAAIIAVVAYADLAIAQSLDEQERCSVQAKKAFQERKVENQELGISNTTSSDYQSHYNTKLKKCLILIEETGALGKEVSTSVSLIDAYERRIYAVYHWVTREGKFWWEVAPVTCELIPTFHAQKTCSTRDEFDAFVSSYMEE